MRTKLPKCAAAISVIAALLTTLSAHAASCTWSAKMEEDEGGSVMTASVCGGPKGDAHLMLACFGKPVLSYDLGTAGGQLEPGISANFAFKAGGKSLTKKLELEAMYNYFTTELSGPADPLLALLRGKGEVAVSADKYGEMSFPLKGSGAAIGKVLAECGKGSGGEAD
ncbi:hypothetical protein RFM41_25265 [Mesorhizobium sp. VK25A]|uniref:Uncharacterized protein n=1 Tax=Mesorhizobium vachelliae TaxID=3072309 RepID=A0ABU5A9Q4_9HYPH|nr:MULTISPECIES: hypothetical protein [unclassified Mesorhizobium]MDX8534439.1 hypothetical protein [Mesorhizobium sp. VK25D]MDX8547081.1 hypothetical protein [Mesorhizobium sp. VK25A]